MAWRIKYWLGCSSCIIFKEASFILSFVWRVPTISRRLYLSAYWRSATALGMEQIKPYLSSLFIVIRKCYLRIEIFDLKSLCLMRISTQKATDLLARLSFSWSDHRDSWLSDSRFLCGLLLFSLGFVINVLADSTLLSLKSGRTQSQVRLKASATQSKCDVRGDSDSALNQNRKEQEGLSEARSSYKIPHGGLFELVSCANYCKWSSFVSLSPSITWEWRGKGEVGLSRCTL